MELIKTPIEGLALIRPKVFSDDRGYFFESYTRSKFQELGFQYNFIQENQSKSKYGVLRGLHFQKGQAAQTKLIRVIYGKILDVVVDLRPESKTYGQHFSVELTEDNFLQLLIPKGFAHGYSVLSESAIIGYKCDSYYDPKSEGGVIYNDPDLAIDWKIPSDKVILSEKDKVYPLLKDLKLS